MTDDFTWSHNLKNGLTLEQRTDILEKHKRLPNGGYGEVLYRGACNIDIAVRAWSESPTHSAIIADERNKYMIMGMMPDPERKDSCIIVGTFMRRPQWELVNSDNL